MGRSKARGSEMHSTLQIHSFVVCRNRDQFIVTSVQNVCKVCSGGFSSSSELSSSSLLLLVEGEDELPLELYFGEVRSGARDSM